MNLLLHTEIITDFFSVIVATKTCFDNQLNDISHVDLFVWKLLCSLILAPE